MRAYEAGNGKTSGTQSADALAGAGGGSFRCSGFCGIFFAVTGRDPFEVYYAMFSGALGSEYGISETIVKMIPLAMCGLGIAIAFRMQIWNIGAEGQFLYGEPVRPAGCR